MEVIIVGQFIMTEIFIIEVLCPGGITPDPSFTGVELWKKKGWSTTCEIATASTCHTQPFLAVGGGHALVSGGNSPVSTPCAKCSRTCD